MDTSLDYSHIIGSTITVTMDRPLGSRHPRHPHILYTVEEIRKATHFVEQFFDIEIIKQ